jgi:hypothetical protein
MPARQILLPLLVPTVVLAASAAILWQWPRLSPSSDELRALMVLLPLLPYALFVVAGGIGLRYGNAGLLLSALAAAFLAAVGSAGAMGETVYYATAGPTMAAAGIEASAMLFYTDELTGRPGSGSTKNCTTWAAAMPLP